MVSSDLKIFEASSSSEQIAQKTERLASSYSELWLLNISLHTSIMGTACCHRLCLLLKKKTPAIPDWHVKQKKISGLLDHHADYL